MDYPVDLNRGLRTSPGTKLKLQSCRLRFFRFDQQLNAKLSNVKNKLLKDLAQNHRFLDLSEIKILGLNYNMF